MSHLLKSDNCDVVSPRPLRNCGYIDASGNRGLRLHCSWRRLSLALKFSTRVQSYTPFGGQSAAQPPITSITITIIIRSRRTIPLRSCWPWVSQPLIHFASTSPSLLCCTCLYGATNWAYRWVTAPFAVLFFAVFHWLYFSCSKLGAAIFYASLSSCLRPFPLSRTPPSQVDSLL